MAENTDESQTNHPWNNLTTVTTIDQGNNVGSTLCLNDTQSSVQTFGQNTRLSSYTTPTFLIQSLVRRLCTQFENDKTRRRNLYTVICEQLHQLGLIDGSYNVTELNALRKQYYLAFSRLFSIARVMVGNERVSRSYLIPEWSRYHEEFQEIGHIAGGGFGQVYKALHRLDGIEYAIKKIIPRSNRMEIIDQYLNEVKTLAKLNHTNIVSYKAAWIEPLSLFPSTIVSPTDSQSGTSTTSEHTAMSEDDVGKSSCNKSSPDSNRDDNEASNTAEQSANKSDLQKSTENDTGSSDIVSFRNSNSSEKSNKSKDKKSKRSESKQTNTDRDICTYEESTSQQVCTYSNGNIKYMILYIQMTLCEQTLAQWMRKRISQTPQSMISTVLQQILCGVNYIHSEKIVHHDIKPSNIFISTSGQIQVQLGDFGLACPLQKETHHSIIGTHLYAAPEQLEGKCDMKSDIYSIGIVLTELLIPTQTQMELITVIDILKCGNVPQAVPNELHKWVHMIIRMVQGNPAKRPSANELLQDLEKDKDARMINELKNTIRDKNSTIQELQDEITSLRESDKDKDSKIQELGDKIASLTEQLKKHKLSEDE